MIPEFTIKAPAPIKAIPAPITRVLAPAVNRASTAPATTKTAPKTFLRTLCFPALWATLLSQKTELTYLIGVTYTSPANTEILSVSPALLNNFTL